MNATLGLLALLTIGMLIAPAVAAEPTTTEAPAGCEFITIGPFFPFIIIDPTCPPIFASDGF